MWQGLAIYMVKLAILSMFVVSIIEVVKGISAVGILGAITGIIKTLGKNDPMKPEAFPVLNFAIALLVCWAFNVTAMSYIFGDLLGIQGASSASQIAVARWLDYFGTASMTYLGSDQLFKRYLSVKDQAEKILETSSSFSKETGTTTTSEVKP